MKRELLLGPLVLLALWSTLAYTGLVNPLFISAPHSVFVKFFGLLFSGDILIDLANTLYRALAGFALACLAGIPIGLAMGYWRRVYKSLEFIVDFFRSLPATALFPLFMLFFGIGDVTKILLVAFSCALIVMVNTSYGVWGSNKTRLMVARTMGASEAFTFARVVLPEALPHVMTGLRVSISLSLILVVVTEMFAGTKFGLGQRIQDAHLTYRISEMYSAIILTGLLGYLLNKGFVFVESRLVHWAGK